MEKKRIVYWVLSLSYIVLVPLLYVLYPLIYSSVFGYRPGFESLGPSVLLLSGIFSLIFYTLLILDGSKKLDTSSVIKKWWGVTWKWDLSIILFLFVIIFPLMGILFSFDGTIILYLVPIIVGVLAFSLLVNCSVFLLTLLRKHISKEVFIIPMCIAFFVLISSLIGSVLYPYSFSLKAHQFELDQIISNFLIPFFIYFFVSLVMVFLSKLIANKMSKKVSLILSLILGLTGLILILIRDLFNLIGTGLKGTISGAGDFIAIFIFLPLSILFYFVYIRKKGK
ncbi:MAG: hypothetical protein AABW91_03030 [Nanoarchaeota archaeon]